MALTASELGMNRTLTERGLDVFASVPPFPGDGLVIDSNATEIELLSWMESRSLAGRMQGAGDGRARRKSTAQVLGHRLLRTSWSRSTRPTNALRSGSCSSSQGPAKQTARRIRRSRSVSTSSGRWGIG